METATAPGSPERQSPPLLLARWRCTVRREVRLGWPKIFGAGGGLVRQLGRVVRAALTSGEECLGADGSGEDFPDDAGVFHPGQAFG